jgi:catechol 2,3-dioxygenase-like lactoylglutathione lyase family enzyme
VKALGLVWVGVPARSYDETVRLFRDVLGLRVDLEEEATTELSLPDGARVQVFAPGHPYHELFDRPVPLFEVDDVRAARRRLEHAGIELLGSIESDAAWEWFNFRGPDGNLYELGSRRG